MVQEPGESQAGKEIGMEDLLSLGKELEDLEMELSASTVFIQNGWTFLQGLMGQSPGLTGATCNPQLKTDLPLDQREAPVRLPVPCGVPTQPH